MIKLGDFLSPKLFETARSKSTCLRPQTIGKDAPQGSGVEVPIGQGLEGKGAHGF